jgi:hypothetical protein
MSRTNITTRARAHAAGAGSPHGAIAVVLGAGAGCKRRPPAPGNIRSARRRCTPSPDSRRRRRIVDSEADGW